MKKKLETVLRGLCSDRLRAGESALVRIIAFKPAPDDDGIMIGITDATGVHHKFAVSSAAVLGGMECVMECE